MSQPDVRHGLLDFEVQSPIKLKEESPEHANCNEVEATKVLGGHAAAGKIKTELDADHLEEGEVKVEVQDNLEDGEISEEEKDGQPELHKKVCRHFAAGRTCLWGQVPLRITSKVVFLILIPQNCRFLHIKKVSKWGNYSMFAPQSPIKAAVAAGTKLSPVKVALRAIQTRYIYVLLEE